MIDESRQRQKTAKTIILILILIGGCIKSLFRGFRYQIHGLPLKVRYRSVTKRRFLLPVVTK